MMKQMLFSVLFLFDVAFAQKYIITRRIKNLDSGQIQPDLVHIPKSLCHNNGTTECTLMDGERHSVCQCICSKKNSFFSLYKSTFQLYNETWKCAKNDALRKISGCSFSLDGAQEINSVSTLPSNATVQHSLSNVTTGSYILMPVTGAKCAVRAENSTYLKCNGQWEQLNSTLVTNRFQISNGPTTADGKYQHVLVWVNSTDSYSHPLPSGRIIKLAVTCSDRPWEPSQCIVAKIQGQLECPVSSIPVTTLRPSIASPTASTSATPSLSTAHPPTVSSSIMSVPPKIPSSISQTFSVVPSSTILQTSPSSPKPNTTTVPKVNNTDDGYVNIFSGTLIAAVLGGIAVFVALVITIVMIAARRKKTRSDDKRKNSRAAFVVENESYEGDDPEADVSNHPYANVNPSTVPTASTNNNNVKDKTNLGGHRNSVTNKVYEVVEEFDNQPSKPPNAENIKQGQQDPMNRTRNQALPSIPESAMYNLTFRDPHHHYYDINDNNNVAPESQYASVYEVIDGIAQSNGTPGVLNENDPRANGASSNMQSESGHGPKGGQDGSFYDTVGGVIVN